jgi:hypothetical protein
MSVVFRMRDGHEDLRSNNSSVDCAPSYTCGLGAVGIKLLRQGFDFQSPISSSSHRDSPQFKLLEFRHESLLAFLKHALESVELRAKVSVSLSSSRRMRKDELRSSAKLVVNPTVTFQLLSHRHTLDLQLPITARIQPQS